MRGFFEQLKSNLGLREIFLSKEQMLTGLADLCMLLTTAYFIIFSLLRSSLLLGFLAVFLVFITCFRWLIRKQKIRIQYAVHFLIFIITFCLFVPLMYFTGGLNSPITAWLALPPLIFVLLFGNRKNTRWWFGVILFILVIFTFLSQRHYAFPNLIPAHLQHIHWFVSTLGVIICTFFIAVIAEHWKRSLLSSLDRTKRMLEKSNEAALIGQWDIDFKERNIHLNPFAREIFGIKEAQLRIDAFCELIKDKVHFQTLLKRLEESKQDQELRLDVVLPVFVFRGKEGWIRFIGIPLHKNGQCTGAYGLIQDINEQKRTEYYLIKERQRLKYALQGANLGTWEWNVQTDEILLNEQWATFLGYELTEVQPMTGSAFQAFIYHEDFDKAKTAMQSYFSGETDIYQCEMRMVHKSGSLIWMLVQGKILSWDEKGNPLWMYGTHLENTKEKLLRENLRLSESYAHSLITSIPDLLFVLSKDGEFLDYKSNEKDLYTKPNLFLGKNFKDIFPAKLGALIEEKVEQSIRTDSLVEFTYSLVLHGQEKYYQARVVPFEGDKIIVLCRDNTENFIAEKELRILNAKFKSILDNSPVGIALVDCQTGMFLEVNPTIPSFTGYDRDELLRLSFSDITPASYHESDKLQLKQLQRTGRFDNYEKEYFRKDGKRIWVSVTGVMFTDVDGEKKLLTIVQDISQQKEQQRALKAAKEQAEIANNAKSEFLANMSHEMRTPLNAIIGFTDLLLKSPLSEAQKEYMRAVFQSGQSLLDLINDLLDLSKIESGKLELVPEPVDLNKLARQVVEILKYQANKKGLDFHLLLSSELPELVLSDGQRLRQVLFNLLSNALKFTEKGCVELDIRIERRLSEKEVIIRFAVTDTGIGIAEEHHQKIFEAFVQENSSIIKRFGGTGLGLTISNRLLSLMGSQLKLKSETGAGSTFYFDLSLTTIAVDESLEEKQASLVEPGSRLLCEVSILLAEDNPTNMLLLKSYFNNIIPNAKLIEAGDGQVALDLFRKFKPDLIITDLQMPKMNGFDLTSRIRSLNEGKEVPIVALTAGILNGEKERCFAVGMNDYLSKPVLQDTLRNVVEKWLSEEQKQWISCVEQKPESLFNLGERLSKILNVKMDDAIEIIGVAKQTLRESMLEIDVFYKQADRDAIKHTAHKIRATALMMGFSAMHKVAYEVENSTLTLNEIQPMIDNLKQEVQYVLGYL